MEQANQVTFLMEKNVYLFIIFYGEAEYNLIT